MNISRAFILVGGLYLLAGITLGMIMSGSGNHDAAPAHAHINLLGFTLMTIFGLVYYNFPGMGQSVLAKVHFWLHLVGTLVLLTLLLLLTTGRIGESAMVPLAPISEGLIILGVLVFLWNAFRNMGPRTAGV